MDFTFDITALGMVVLIIGAAVYGVILNLFGEMDPAPYGWVLTGVGAFLGAFAASEYIGLDTFAPVWEGVALVPALVGGLLVGGAVELVIRLVRGGSSVQGSRPI
jgi:hypothetical protein